MSASETSETYTPFSSHHTGSSADISDSWTSTWSSSVADSSSSRDEQFYSDFSDVDESLGAMLVKMTVTRSPCSSDDVDDDSSGLEHESRIVSLLLGRLRRRKSVSRAVFNMPKFCLRCCTRLRTQKQVFGGEIRSNSSFSYPLDHCKIRGLAWSRLKLRAVLTRAHQVWSLDPSTPHTPNTLSTGC